jgi:hypothetical protein
MPQIPDWLAEVTHTTLDDASAIRLRAGKLAISATVSTNVIGAIEEIRWTARSKTTGSLTAPGRG